MSDKYVIVMNEGSNQYEQIRYPAGEWQVRLTDEVTKEIIEDNPNVVLVSRIKSSDDLIKTSLLCDAVNYLTPKFNLVLPYYPYSRADRRFKQGDCLGKSIVQRVMRYVTDNGFITTMDIHSKQFGDGVINVDPLEEIQKTGNLFAQYHNTTKVNVLFPDKGASTRYADMLSVRPWFLSNRYVGKNIYHCEKVRNQLTGKFEGFKVPDIDKSLPTIIIDDICDGGGTFIGIAKELGMPKDLMGLYVTHGIFSKGFDELTSFFGKIITTNSYYDKEHGTDPVYVINCLPSLLRGIE